jgi:hypothetical protein
MNYDDLENKLKSVQQCKDMEFAIKRCQAGIVNHGIIYKICAESDYGVMRGGADRNIDLPHTPLTMDESVKVFSLIEEMLTARLAATQAKLVG